MTMSPSWWPFHHIHFLHHHDHQHQHHEHPKLHHQEQQDDDPTVTSDESERSSIFNSTHSSSSTSSLSCLLNKDDGEHQQRIRQHRRRRHVSFHPQVTQYDHIHNSEYTSDERQKTWYCHHELHIIHKDNQRTVHWMISSNHNQGRLHRSGGGGGQLVKEEEEEYCCRGLEHKTPMGIKARYQRQFIAMEATIKYQYHEWDYNRRNPCVEEMAKIYRKHSQPSVNMARLAGQIDYEYVLRNKKGDEKESSITSAPTSTTTPTTAVDSNKASPSKSSSCTRATSPVEQQQSFDSVVTPPTSPAAAA